MTNDSLKLALVWSELKKIKNKIDNEIIPISGHLRLEDPELMTAMEELAEKIGNHLDRFKLVAEMKRNG